MWKCFCDKCDKECKDSELKKVSLDVFDTRHLCDSCYKSFIEFFERGELHE